MPINMPDFNRARCAAKCANVIARRRAGVGAVTECPVSDLMGFLAPTLATLAALEDKIVMK
jgi:hypothetical protein